MRTHIDYLFDISVLDSFDIDDIGNCSLSCFSDNGLSWYISTKTVLGYTQVVTFGPLKNGQPTLDGVQNFYLTQETIEYNEHKLINKFEKLLQDPRKNITQVIEVDYDKVKEKLNRIKFMVTDDDC